MPSLLSLPRELRDEIWDRSCHNEFPPYGVTTHSNITAPEPRSHQLLLTNRQIYHEAAPYVYETTVVNLSHPNAAVSWIHSIGTRNSACIRHLVLKFTTLSFENPQQRTDVLETWSTSLQLLPNLQSLTFNYEPKDCKQPWAAVSQDEHSTKRSLAPREELATLPEPETLKLQKGRSYDLEMRHLQPDYRFQSITHAVLAIHEPMPSILVLYFAKLLKLSSASSLEQNITCLPTDFLAGLGFYPTRTYALTDGPPSIVFTYCKLDAPPQRPAHPAPNLNLMLSQLPQLTYLRLGCHQVNSSILAAIPSGIKTLDIAFTDPNPWQVGTNLHKMRRRCPKLFTLTIAVSPLHDPPLPQAAGDDATETVEEIEAKAVEHDKFWEPFWDALSVVAGTGVRVWEGEGDRFRKFVRRDGGMGPESAMF